MRFFSAVMHLRSRVIKMAVIGQQVVIWLQHSADTIAKTFDTTSKSFRTYTALLQGHNCQSKILSAW